MHLFRPYQAMKEIWMASVPSSATPWQQRAAPALLGWWWALWLASGAIGLLSFRLWMGPVDVDGLRQATWATIASDAVDIPLAIVAVLLVRNIHRTQEHSRTTTVFD
jgi:hypothetical protein